MSKDRKLLIRRPGENWMEPDSFAYENESHLQKILAAGPAQIPGVDAASLTALELPAGGGYVDVCVVGRDGSITVVECKLASNSERRRMVIGQVIDYAAAIWLDGADAFIESWRRHTKLDLTAELDDSAMETLRSNIASGRIDLCLAVDQIDADLRRLVEYLNLVTADEVWVTSLQLSYAESGDVEILIPTTFGGEIAAAKASKASVSTRWTIESFLEALGTDEDRGLARKLFNQTEGLERAASLDPFWFGKSLDGKIFLHPRGLAIAPVYLSINKDRRLMRTGTWNQFAKVHHHEGFAQLAQLIDLDYRAGARGRAAAGFDPDTLWATIVACATAINTEPEES